MREAQRDYEKALKIDPNIQKHSIILALSTMG